MYYNELNFPPETRHKTTIDKEDLHYLSPMKRGITWGITAGAVSGLAAYVYLQKRGVNLATYRRRYPVSSSRFFHGTVSNYVLAGVTYGGIVGFGSAKMAQWRGFDDRRNIQLCYFLAAVPAGLIIKNFRFTMAFSFYAFLITGLLALQFSRYTPDAYATRPGGREAQDLDSVYGSHPRYGQKMRLQDVWTGRV